MQAPRTGFVELPDARLFYEISGSGEPVVLMHGGLLDLRMWDQHVAALSSTCMVLRYDMRYAGRSEAHPTTEPFIPYRDAMQLLQALDIPRATLIGLSGGARVAIDLAIACPTMVQRLIAISPGMSGYTFRDPWVHERGAAMRQALEQYDDDAATECHLSMWMDGPYRRPAQISPDVRARVRTMVMGGMRHMRQTSGFRELEPPAIGRLAEIQAPTLVILGDQDSVDILTIGQLIKTQVADARLITLAGAGHLLVMEQPEAFVALVLQFVQP